jgi:Bax inhibitor 1
MLIVVAFLATTTIFLCFAGFAIFSQRRSQLYLGGFLSSAISTMLLFSFFNIFFNSSANYFIQLYFGLLVFMGYVVFDTQMIIEKASFGDRDYVAHSLDLFIDFVAIFIRVLIILTNNKKSKKEERE